MNRRKPNRLREKSGFTVVEVLIAALIAGIALTAAFEVFINHNKSHVIQSGVTELQQNGRAAVDELVTNIRKAGYKLPEGLPALAARNTNPDTIMVAFVHEPICSATVSDNMSQPTSQIECAGNNLSCFSSNTWAYIWDDASDSGEFFYVTNVQAGAGYLEHDLAPLTRCYGIGSKVYIIDYYKYFVDNTDTLRPRLMRQSTVTPDVYADHITNLQLQYVMADGSVYDTIAVDRYVREVLIDITARTARQDLFMEDYRYETYSTRVRVRNL
jgi:prepilin-type N-terminal cleavage/methylation domain-containing protein